MPTAARTSGINRLIPFDWRSAPMMDWIMSHSLTKPLVGGIAAMDSTPTRETAASAGRAFARPPVRPMFFSPVQSSTVSMVMSISDLKTEWLRVCRRPAIRISLANTGDSLRKIMPRAMHSTTSAMFSMLEYAIIFLGSFCTRDSRAPQRAVAAEIPIITKATTDMESCTPMYENMLLNITSIATLEHTVDRRAAVCIGAVA